MFQQNIEVSQPHFKPAVFKTTATDNELSDEGSVMPLEYFAAYELELQETILQLNSELDGDSETSDCEEDDSFMNGCLHGDKLSDSESSSSEELETVNQVHEISSNVHQQECDEGVNEFGDCELSLQNAVHELASLSDVLVSMFA